MNLEIAQEIIEREALLILLANPLLLEKPHLKFDLNNYLSLSRVFNRGDSKIVSFYTFYHDNTPNKCQHCIWCINHPNHGIGYYRISAICNLRGGEFNLLTAMTPTSSSPQLLKYRHGILQEITV